MRDRTVAHPTGEAVRLFGRMDDDKLIEAAIKAGKPIPRVSKRDFTDIKRLAEMALEYENLPALVSLAKSNRFAVSSVLNMENLVSLGRIAGRGGIATPQLYFALRGQLDEERRKIFRRFARDSLLRISLRIAGEGLRGDVPVRSEYQPGYEFDLEETIERVMERLSESVPMVRISEDIRTSDIVAIEKRQRKKSGILIIDASGSMMGDKNINAAIAAAVMAYSMRHDQFGVIAFNNRPVVIKDVNEKVPVQKIVDRILELEAIGYTNIEAALRKGREMMQKLRTRLPWAVLITDGAYNQGGDPRPYARDFKKLHVVNLPGKKWGRRVCMDLARLGGGRYVSVQSYFEVPRQLMKIMRSPW